jgi:hypothetical protein
MVLISHIWFNIQGLVRHTSSFYLRQSTDKLMSQGFLQSCSRTAFHKFYGRNKDVDCQYNISFGHKVFDVFHTNCDPDYVSYRLPDLEIGFMAGVASRQGMLTYPRHLIPPLYPDVRVCPHSLIHISYRTYEIDYCSLCMPFYTCIGHLKLLLNSSCWKIAWR